MFTVLQNKIKIHVFFIIQISIDFLKAPKIFFVQDPYEVGDVLSSKLLSYKVKGLKFELDWNLYPESKFLIILCYSRISATFVMHSKFKKPFENKTIYIIKNGSKVPHIWNSHPGKIYFSSRLLQDAVTALLFPSPLLVQLSFSPCVETKYYR